MNIVLLTLKNGKIISMILSKKIKLNKNVFKDNSFIKCIILLFYCLYCWD